MHTQPRRARAGFAVLLVQLCVAALATAATVPAGFDDRPYVQLPVDATAMEFAPDGRLFVCQQSGKLRVVQDGTLLATPFLSLTVDSSGERGLLGVAFDPDFERNQYVYVHYTATTPTIHNRVSRFTANGNVAVPGSEVVLLDLDPLSTARNHNGGALHFGNDGKLYVAVGDNANADNAQLLTNPFGKVLRLNRDGTIPAGNPFVDRTSGVDRAIWALGLRNPFTMAFQRSTGRLLINDVGQQTFEEINLGAAGANFGWPAAEGPSSVPAYTNPLHYYGHADGSCAVTGGTFYEPAAVTFPSWNYGKYFFADYCGGWIRRLNPGTGAVTGFATGVAGPVDLKVGPDGALYYLARNAAVVGRIAYGAGPAPAITQQPASRTIAVGQSVTFKVGASGASPLAIQWRRNGTPIAGATAASYTRWNVPLADDGAGFDVVVSNAFGRVTSATARLTVLQDSVPTANITKPLAGTRYTAGTVISYAGTGHDVEDGTLPARAFTWWVNLHHDDHTHPLLLPVSGAKSGSFTIPATGETSANVFYRIHLRVRDSAGLTRTVHRDLLPRKRTVTLASNPTGLKVKLDGLTLTTPYRLVGVVGMQRRVEAVSPQAAAGSTWTFQSWSDGGARIHTIRTPGVDTTYTARFTAQ